MKVFVQRDGMGAIIGAFANLQPGYAEEELDDTSAELQLFLNPPPPSPAEEAGQQVATNRALKGLVVVLANRFDITPQQLIDAIKAAAD